MTPYAAMLIPVSIAAVLRSTISVPAVSGRAAMASLDETVTSANTYHQEAVIRTAAGNETHGGTDVFLGAIGKGSETFLGTIDNTKVFGLVKTAGGL